jgi:hypothetical protein
MLARTASDEFVLILPCDEHLHARVANLAE